KINSGFQRLLMELELQVKGSQSLDFFSAPRIKTPSFGLSPIGKPQGDRILKPPCIDKENGSQPIIPNVSSKSFVPYSPPPQQQHHPHSSVNNFGSVSNTSIPACSTHHVSLQYSQMHAPPLPLPPPPPPPPSIKQTSNGIFYGHSTNIAPP